MYIMKISFLLETNNYYNQNSENISINNPSPVPG